MFYQAGTSSYGPPSSLQINGELAFSALLSVPAQADFQRLHEGLACTFLSA